MLMAGELSIATLCAIMFVLAFLTMMSNHSCFARYHAHGVLVLNENHITADYAKIYFDGTATSRDVIVDNLEVMVAPKQCSDAELTSHQHLDHW